MAITGVLNADFSTFYTEVQKAEVSLKGMEGGAVKVEAAISNVGTRAAPPMNTLRDSFRQFDQAMSASGVNISKYAGGLADIADSAGKTVSQLGLLATAGLVVSAGMAGWKIGEKIGEWTGWTKAIQDNAAALMGWGVAAQGSAAATREFLKNLKDTNDAYAVSAERLAAAQANVRSLNAAQLAGIEIALKNHATVEQITKAYGISADGLRVLAEQKKLTAAQADLHAAAMKREEAAAKAYDVEIANQIVLFDNLNKAAKAQTDMKASNNAAAGWIAQQVAIKKGIDDEAAATRAYLTEQEALTAATDALSAAHTTAGTAAVTATSGAMAGYAGVAQQVQISGDAIKEWIALMKYAAQANEILSRNSLFTTTSQHQALAALSGPKVSGASGAVGNRGGAAVSNVFNIVDTEANIAKRVSDRISQSLAQAGAV